MAYISIDLCIVTSLIYTPIPRPTFPGNMSVLNLLDVLSYVLLFLTFKWIITTNTQVVGTGKWILEKDRDPETAISQRLLGYLPAEGARVFRAEETSAWFAERPRRR